LWGELTVRRNGARENGRTTYLSTIPPDCAIVSRVTKDAVDRWLRAYVEAWKAYDPKQIAALFAEDVTYRYHPYDQPIHGRHAVVGSWLGEGGNPDASTRDEPGTYEATYAAVAVDGDTAVAVGQTTYSPAPGSPPDDVFENCFVMRFDADGRCREFTEWYIQRPKPEAGPAA
jgi:ketosteroid isomerase-like protein